MYSAGQSTNNIPVEVIPTKTTLVESYETEIPLSTLDSGAQTTESSYFLGEEYRSTKRRLIKKKQSYEGTLPGMFKFNDFSKTWKGLMAWGQKYAIATKDFLKLLFRSDAWGVAHHKEMYTQHEQLSQTFEGNQKALELKDKDNAIKSCQIEVEADDLEKIKNLKEKVNH